MVFVTHDIHEALLLATRIGLFEAGRLVGSYTPEEFRRAPDPLVRKYLAVIECEQPMLGGVAEDSARG